MTGVCALIPAAGRGVRFGASENKVFADLLGRSLLGWTLQAFARCDAVDDVVLIGGEADLPRLRAIGAQFGGGKVRNVVVGGADRQASVRNGLAALGDPDFPLQGDAEYVLIHDAARCCVTPEIIRTVAVAARREGGGATAAIPVSDTLVRENGESVDRDRLWSVQTPQGFDRGWITQAHERALREGWQAADDAGLSERQGRRALLVFGSPENIKVTRPEDLALAEAILARRQYSPSPAAPGEGHPKGTRERGHFRVGHGYDVHPFADDRKMMLGGVYFPESPRGLAGHSDADALLHAVCDALLGAAGRGDIGTLFPPSDHAHKDRPSIEFVGEVKRHLDEAGFRVGNIDVTVLAETPKIGPRAAEIKRVLADALGISSDQVGIKATTSEGMGFVGRAEGIAVHAAALIHR